MRPKQKIFVRRHLDNSVSIWREGQRLGYKKLTSAPEKKAPPKKVLSSTTRSEAGRKGKQRSPWSKMPAGWLNPKTYAHQTVLHEKTR